MVPTPLLFGLTGRGGGIRCPEGLQALPPEKGLAAGVIASVVTVSFVSLADRIADGPSGASGPQGSPPSDAASLNIAKA